MRELWGRDMILHMQELEPNKKSSFLHNFQNLENML